jgi:hypothetical protein
MFLAFLAAQAAVLDFKQNIAKARADTSVEKVNLSAFAQIAIAAALDDVCERHLKDLVATPDDGLDHLDMVKRRTFMDEWADARDLTEGERTVLSGLCVSYMDGRQADERKRK